MSEVPRSLSFPDWSSEPELIHRYVKRMEIMHRIDVGIINASTVQEIAETVLKHIHAIIPSRRAEIVVFERAFDQMLVLSTEADGPDAPVQVTRSPLPGDYLAEFTGDKISLVEDGQLLPESSPAFQRLSKFGLRSSLSVLVLHQQENLGALTFYAERPGFFTHEHQEIAEQIGSQLAIAIHQQWLTNRLKEHTVQLTQMVEARTAELQTGKARVEAILHNSPDSILLIETDLSIQQANPSFAQLVGCPPESYLGRSLLDFVQADDIERLEAIIQETITTQQGTNIELRAQRHDGSRFDAELSIGPIQDDGLVCIVRDITRRKEQERQLRYHASLQDNVSDAVIVTTPDLRIQSWNKAAERIYGWTEQEVIGRPAPEIVRTKLSPGDSERIIEAVYTRGWWREEVIQHHKDGSIRHILGSITKIDDEHGQTISLVSINHDITEYKQIEAALRESEERFRQVAEHFDQALFIRSADNSELLYINPKYEQLMGAPRHVLYENPNAFLKIIHADDLDHVRGYMTSRRFTQEGITEFEYRIIQADQQIRWMRTHTFPIKNEVGEIVRRVGLVEDITDRKRVYEAMQEALAQERELSELKSRFVSMASHEFRTPLSTILTISETLHAYWHRFTEAQIKQRLGTVKEQVGYLQGIMEDVLLLARIQAQHIEFRPVKTDPDALCRTILDEFQDLNLLRALRYTFDGAIHEALLDPKLMRHIISNLVSNALKYSPEDAPVDICLDHVDDALVLKVSDSGIGIPEADLKHLFEPFHRGANVTTISGTGLGLVIAKEAVEQHGGTIQVESHVGEGTTFTVHIPIFG